MSPLDDANTPFPSELRIGPICVGPQQNSGNYHRRVHFLRTSFPPFHYLRRNEVADVPIPNSYHSPLLHLGYFPAAAEPLVCDGFQLAVARIGSLEKIERIIHNGRVGETCGRGVRV